MHAMMWIMRFPHSTLLAVLLVALFGQPVVAQGLGDAIELVDPNSLRVCADPHNLPFSDEAGQGFENKIAELLGKQLHRPVSYSYFPQVVGFFRVTLNAFRCDVVIGVPQWLELVQTTKPYYRTTYALVFKPGQGLDGIGSIEDARLKDKRLGVVARTPPATLMVQAGLMDRAKPYPLTVDTRVDAPGKSMIDDLQAGTIDVAVLWGPIAGYFVKHAETPLSIAPLLAEKGAPMDFRIAMGVRHSDQNWKRTLDKLIHDNQGEIDRILADYGVPLLDEQGKPLAP
jgi:quinoprotein dehydrogenase-associated probable ABC transporter substrate-binding protein